MRILGYIQFYAHPLTLGAWGRQANLDTDRVNTHGCPHQGDTSESHLYNVTYFCKYKTLCAYRQAVCLSPLEPKVTTCDLIPWTATSSDFCFLPNPQLLHSSLKESLTQLLPEDTLTQLPWGIVSHSFRRRIHLHSCLRGQTYTAAPWRICLHTCSRGQNYTAVQVEYTFTAALWERLTQLPSEYTLTQLLYKTDLHSCLCRMDFHICPQRTVSYSCLQRMQLHSCHGRQSNTAAPGV